MTGRILLRLLLWGFAQAIRIEHLLHDKMLDALSLLFDEQALNETMNMMAQSAANRVYQRVNHAPHCDLGAGDGETVTSLDQSIRRYL